MLSGTEIKKEIKAGRIKIEPYEESRINPNSYNLRLSDELLVYDTENGYLDSKNKNRTKTIKIPEEGYLLQPNKLYLGRTMEYTETDFYVPMLNGRSSIGRLGISIHVTAGFGDVGFKGTWTLEIFCIEPVKIYPGMELCQICYYPVEGDQEIKYQGKYLGQQDIIASKLYEEYKK